MWLLKQNSSFWEDSQESELGTEQPFHRRTRYLPAFNEPWTPSAHVIIVLPTHWCFKSSHLSRSYLFFHLPEVGQLLGVESWRLYRVWPWAHSLILILVSLADQLACHKWPVWCISKMQLTYYTKQHLFCFSYQFSMRPEFTSNS